MENISDSIIIKIIEISPTILLYLLFFIIYLKLRKSQCFNDLIVSKLKNTKSVKAFGIEAEFYEIEKILEEAANNNKAGTVKNRLQVLKRAEFIGEILKNNIQILFVNDNPSDMRDVIDILKSLKIKTKIVTGTKFALDELSKNQYDVIISDMMRQGNRRAGLEFLEMSIRSNLNKPTIFTVGNYQPEKGVPANAFGITNKIDELLHLIFDILERKYL